MATMKTALGGMALATTLILQSHAAWCEDLQLNPALKIVDKTSEKAYPPSAKKGFVIGLSNISVANTWRVQMIEEAKFEASKHPEVAQLLVTDAGGNSSKQVADIEDMIVRKVDAIMVAPGSETALNGVLDKAFNAGIPVIIFSSNATPRNYTVKVLADDKDFGRIGAEYLAKAIGGKGSVIAVRGIPGNSIDNDRWIGATEVFKKYPGIKVVGEGYGDWAYDKGKKVCESLILAHPDINGIWSSGGAMTQACAEVLQENGLKSVPMTGEGSNGFLRVWQKMKLQSVAPQSPTWFGQQAELVTLRVLKGLPVAKDYLVRPDPITAESVQKFYRADLKDSYWVGSSLPETVLKTSYKN